MIYRVVSVCFQFCRDARDVLALKAGHRHSQSRSPNGADWSIRLVKRYLPGDISAKRVQLPELIANASGVTRATLALK